MLFFLTNIFIFFFPYYMFSTLLQFVLEPLLFEHPFLYIHLYFYLFFKHLGSHLCPFSFLLFSTNYYHPIYFNKSCHFSTQHSALEIYFGLNNGIKKRYLSTLSGLEQSNVTRLKGYTRDVLFGSIQRTFKLGYSKKRLIHIPQFIQVTR